MDVAPPLHLPTTNAFPPPLPTPQREPLLRGPLILAAVGRVLSILFYSFCAYKATGDLQTLFVRYRPSARLYLTDMVLLAVSLWVFVMFNLLLTWLFFSRRRSFRPLMIYYNLLLPALIACIAVHASHYPVHRHPHQVDPPGANVFAGVVISVLLSAFFWPFYYALSPRVRRVFTC